MKCELSNRKQLIEDYVTGILSREEIDAFDEHCFNCDLCFQELRLKEEVAALIKEEGKIIFADYLEKHKAKKVSIFNSILEKLPRFSLQWQTPRWAYATVAAGAIAVLCFFIYRNIFTPHNGKVHLEKSQIAQDQDSTQIMQPIVEREDSVRIEEPHLLVEKQKIEQEDEIKDFKNLIEETAPDIKLDMQQAYAANFEASPYLEEMITDINRSYSINILSPKIGQNREGDILFNWEISDESIAYLIILNNRGLELYNFKPENNRFLFTEKLEPGLYYWKLESEEDLLFMGKFLVEK